VTYNFLTCDGVIQYIDIGAFWKPFQFQVWISAIIIFTAISVVLAKLFGRFHIKDSAALLLPRIILEQGTNLSRRLDSIGRARLFFTSLCLVTIVFSNAYKGQLTSALAAPYAATRLTKVNEALGNEYNILVGLPKRMKNFAHLFKIEKDLANKAGIKILIGVIPMLRSTFYSIVFAPYIPLLNMGSTKIPNGILSNVCIQESEEAMQRKLLQCNKTIFIGEPFELDALNIEIQESKHKFKSRLYYGSDSFMTHPVVWEMSPMHWDRTKRIHTRLQSLIHSGLFNYTYKMRELRNTIQKQRFLANRSTKYPEALSFGKNIIPSTILVFAVAIAVACLRLLVEMLWNYVEYYISLAAYV
jgi:hypothetical protein